MLWTAFSLCGRVSFDTRLPIADSVVLATARLQHAPLGPRIGADVACTAKSLMAYGATRRATGGPVLP